MVLPGGPNCDQISMSWAIWSSREDRSGRKTNRELLYDTRAQDRPPIGGVAWARQGLRLVPY